MPILPLDHPEPLAATLGIMLYPGFDDESRRRARAYTTQFLAEPLRRFHDAGCRLSYDELLRITTDGGTPLGDIPQRWASGMSMGNLYISYAALARQDPTRASWRNATKVVEAHAKQHQANGVRSSLYAIRREYGSVAHLWAAWCLRGETIRADPEVGYDGWHDLQYFLAEAEVLRRPGRFWTKDSIRIALPPIAVDAWRVPDDWEPPAREVHWPRSGGVVDFAFQPDQISGLKRAGRPSKSQTQ